ncbi:molecular chaperone [Pseudomonas putida]|nr:molecular chaperone [Pseudomonas putida]
MHSTVRALAVSSACLLAGVGGYSEAYAALTIDTTRIVYSSDKRSVSVIIANPSEHIYAAQTWVNTQSDDTTTAVPFVTAPALFRLNAGKEQTVNVSALPNNLPNDRESLFFFNLQEIPQALPEQSNVLSVALRTRIKVFYRPSQLTTNPVSRLKELGFSITPVNGQPHLHVRNPTPFHYTFSRLDLKSTKQQQAVPGVDMLAPMSERSYPLPAGFPSKDLNVVLSVINDYGGSSSPLTLPVHNTP